MLIRTCLYSPKQQFFEKARSGFPVFTGFIFENLICLAITHYGMKSTEDVAEHCPPLAGDQGGGLAQVRNFRHIYCLAIYNYLLKQSWAMQLLARRP